MLELLEKWTENQRQTTEDLIESVGQRDPNVMNLVDMVCPANIGNEAYIDTIHECVIESSRKLQIHFTNLLISSSKKFRKKLGKKIWRTLMTKAAEYRFDEQKKVDESILKEKVLALRVLSDAYRKAME